MFKYFRAIVLALVWCTLASFFSACSDSDDETPATEGAYTVWLQVGSWPNTFQYIVGTPSLKEGSVNLTGNGAEVTGTADYGIIPGNGFYYYHSPTKGRFSKFTFENNTLSPALEVPFTHLSSIGGFAWANANTLVLIGTNGDSNKVLYSSVDVTTLQITNGELALPAIPTGFKYYQLGSVEIVNGKLFVALAYTQDWPEKASHTFNVAVVDYPSFNYVKMLTDDRSVGPGPSALWMPGSFVDEKGDTYIMTNPRWLYDGVASAIYRIKSGTTVLDANYFFKPLTSSLASEAVGLWYLGNGQAILKYKDGTIADDGSDTAHIYGFAVVNIGDGTIVKKISEIPLDKGEYLQNVVIEDGKAYILSNSQSGSDYVWEYDPATGKAVAGLEVVGGYDYMLRIDKLK